MSENPIRERTTTKARGRPSQDATEGTPFAPHTAADTEAMLSAIGAESVDALFDIPDPVEFTDGLGIGSETEREVTRRLRRTLEENESPTAFLGRGHYEHYVPSVVDHLSDRSEFLTSYTQYQPEISQGFLQALFEYQSLLVELTGLDVANCSMYDAATALGETALLADRLRATEGSRVLVPEYLRAERRGVLENYVAGSGLEVAAFPTEEGVTTPATLDPHPDDDVVMVYVENPTSAGVVEEHLGAVGDLFGEETLFCVGSDPVALALLERPADAGADVAIGDASALGMPAAGGMGLGLFACREAYLRQVPGRLVGASEDADGNRAYSLTLQTREQHIRRERATSNICTNQAWVALRAAIHAASLGPSGLSDLAKDCARFPAELAPRLDAIPGVTAPVADRHHFREFRARVDRDARAVAEELYEAGFAVDALNADDLQICVTETNADATDDLVAAFREVVA
jgi:glycine dehydrogenase subunit 1